MGRGVGEWAPFQVGNPHHHNFASEVALQLGWLTQPDRRIGDAPKLAAAMEPRSSGARNLRPPPPFNLPVVCRTKLCRCEPDHCSPVGADPGENGALLFCSARLPHFWHLANSPLPTAHCPLHATRRASCHVQPCQARPVRGMRLVVPAVAVALEPLPSVVGWAQPRLVVVASHPAAPRPIAPAPPKRPAPWPTA